MCNVQCCKYFCRDLLPFRLMLSIVCYPLCCCKDANFPDVGLMKDDLYYKFTFVHDPSNVVIIQSGHRYVRDRRYIKLNNYLYITTRGDMARRISNFIYSFSSIVYTKTGA